MLDWDFRLYLLGHMGLGIKWQSWIRVCVFSIYLFILINESPKGFFKAQIGLRQGDSPSPFLFVVVGEALSLIMEVSNSASLIKGFEVTGIVSIVNHF